MAVEVADTLTAKNNGKFPVVDDTAVAGGLHTYATTAEREAVIGTQLAKEGMIAYDKEAEKHFKLVPSEEEPSTLVWEEFSTGAGFGTYVEDAENGDYIII